MRPIAPLIPQTCTEACTRQEWEASKTWDADADDGGNSQGSTLACQLQEGTGGSWGSLAGTARDSNRQQQQQRHAEPQHYCWPLQRLMGGTMMTLRPGISSLSLHSRPHPRLTS
jgi:hypothetical protein